MCVTLQTRVLPSFTEEPWYDEPASEVRAFLVFLLLRMHIVKLCGHYLACRLLLLTQPRRKCALVCANCSSCSNHATAEQVDFGLITLAQPVGRPAGWLGLQSATLADSVAANLTTIGKSSSCAKTQ
jgi:hypothetical protein